MLSLKDSSMSIYHKSIMLFPCPSASKDTLLVQAVTSRRTVIQAAHGHGHVPIQSTSDLLQRPPQVCLSQRPCHTV